MQLKTIVGFLCLLTIPALAENKATIDVDINKIEGPVNPQIFGHNLEVYDSYGIFRMTHNYVPAQTANGIYDPKTDTYDSKVIKMTKDLGASVMRYPGGCLTHNFEWKKTIGPRKGRPNFTFGLNEFLRFCKLTDTTPLITVTTYAGTPQDAADLVEYLNAPATDKFPWAKKRAADGHPEAYGVTYFEIGNESDHGNHLLKPFRKHTPQQYAAFFNQCVTKMKAIDPKIKIGAHMATGKDPGNRWDRVVLKIVKNTADFIVIHTYYVGMTHRDKLGMTQPNTDRIMRACMAVGNQAEKKINAFRDLIKKICGKALPIAITEYNAGFVQEKPIPYRFTFGAAMMCADYMRIMLKPENNIMMANYWQYHTGYWGMLRHNKDKTGYNKSPAFPLFKMFTQHLGDELVKNTVISPTKDFEGYNKAFPTGEKITDNKNLEITMTTAEGKHPGFTWNYKDGVYTGILENCTKDYYLGFAEVAKDTPAIYELSFEARFSGAPVQQAVLGLGLSDSRGWEKTRSAVAAEGIEKAKEWTPFSAYFLPLVDCTKLGISIRVRNTKDDPLTGKLEVRNIKVTKKAGYKPYPVVTAISSIAKDGKKLFVTVFNKDNKNDITTTINCPEGNIKSAKYWQISSENMASIKEDQCKIIENKQINDVKKDQLTMTLPARSMTAIEMERK